jgi:PHS family inorganic phosphate transporter-like MFS transporter
LFHFKETYVRDALTTKMEKEDFKSSDSETIQLLNGRIKLNRARIQKIVVSGVGFFSDAYDLFIINIVMLIMSKNYRITDADKAAISSAALVGAIIGQLTFGYVGDTIGRKKAFVITLTLVVIGAILSTMSFQLGFITVFSSLAAFRFVLGIGIGGEYPLSATITSESSDSSNRGRMVATVFSMQVCTTLEI